MKRPGSKDYDDAIDALHAAKTQRKPDGRPCAVCGDNDHQAFECRHNPLVAMRRLDQLERAVALLHEQLHRAMGPDR